MSKLFHITLVVAVLIFSLTSYSANKCATVFKTMKPYEMALYGAQSPTPRSFVKVIEVDSILPHNIKSEIKVYTKDELAKVAPRVWGLSQREMDSLLSKIVSDQVIAFTPLGPSIWEPMQLYQWLELGRQGKTKDIDKAQAFVESLLNTSTKSFGLSEFWLSQLRASSKRLYRARARAVIDLSKNNSITSEIKKSSEFFEEVNQRTLNHLVSLTQKEDGINFAWGTDARFPDSNKMAPQMAYEVVNTLAKMVLIEQTLLFQNENAYSIKGDDQLGLETQLLLASYPELFPLASYFYKYPVSLEYNVTYAMGAKSSTIDFLNNRLDIGEASFDIISYVRDGEVILVMHPLMDSFRWSKGSVDRLIFTKLQAAIRSVVGTHKPYEAQYSSKIIDGMLYVKFDGMRTVDAGETVFRFFESLN